MSNPRRIFISAGEASGDNYGALILQALRERQPAAEFFGCAGPQLAAAGCDAVVHAASVTMVGLVEVLPGLPRAWRALQSLKKSIRDRRPDLAILIDFPDFNLRLAEYLKERGVPVLYFVAPQVWAWRKKRIHTIRRVVDRLLCIFPFEEEFFRRAGVNVEFVGHPLVSRARPRMGREGFLRSVGLPADCTPVALVPGSRRGEVALNLPEILQAARQLSPGTNCRFLLPAAPGLSDDWFASRFPGIRQIATITRGQFHDTVAHSRAAIVASGTASTETAILGTPMVIVYRVNGLSWLLGRRLVDIPFFSIVNLVAGREIVPELIQDKFTASAIVSHMRKLLPEGAARARMLEELRQVVAHLGGVSPRAEREISDPIQRAAAIAESMILGRA